MKRTVRAAVGLTALATFAVTACGSDSKTATTTPASSAPTSAPASSAPATSAPAASTTAAPAGGSSAPAASTTAAPAGGSAAPAGATTITIKGFKFEIPDGLKAGAQVTITNEDSANHTFTDKDGKFDVTVDAGKSATLTLPAAGTYQIKCKIHPSMSGDLTVA